MGKYSKAVNLQGTLLPNGLYALGFALHGWIGSSPRSIDKSLVMVEASLYSTLIATGLKRVIREDRPDGSDHFSFPSGHATAIGSFAGVVIAQEPLGYGIAAAALAGLVSYGRMNDNRHYLHDVFAGLCIGIPVGLGIGRNHREVSAKAALTILPTSTNQGLGLIASLPI